MANDEVIRPWWQPCADIALLMPVGGACMFADIGRENFDVGVLSAIPVAPKTRAGTYVENTANGKAPPGTQRMYALGEVGNFLGIMHARLSIETFVVRAVEGGLLRHRLVLSEGVQ